MSSAFQTVVKPIVSHEQRRKAIDTLVQEADRTSLAVVVQTDGLRGEYRRRALDGLAECDGRDQLEALAEDTTIDPSLRRRAEELR